MTTYLVNFPTKKAFKEAVAAGRNVRLADPNTFDVTHTTLRDIHDRIGHTVNVTNWKRSWFATVTVQADRKIKVS